MIIGGTQVTTQTYIWDQKSPEVVRTCIHTDCRDRFLTQAFYHWTNPNGYSMLLCFGMSRVHVFDNETHKWSSLEYKFDDDSATQVIHSQMVAA